MTDRPPDLMPVSEAAALVNRSLSTIRGWVRKGDLTGYRQDPKRPTNSRLMVSRTALLTRCGLPIELVNTAPPESETHQLSLRPQSAAQMEVDSLRAVVEVLRTTVSVLEGRVEAEQQLVEQWRDRAERSRAALRSTRAELAHLQAQQNRSWWQKLFGFRAPQPLEAK